jgi:hypothetical protein
MRNRETEDDRLLSPRLFCTFKLQHRQSVWAPLSLQGFTNLPWNQEFSPKVFMGRTDTFRVFPEALWIGDVESKNQIGCHVLSLLSVYGLHAAYDLRRRAMQHR